MFGLPMMYDRFLVNLEKLRSHWHRREQIKDDMSVGLKEVPGRWKDSDKGAKLTVLIIVALCATGVALTLW